MSDNMLKKMNAKICLRYDTKDNFAATEDDLVLGAGEMAIISNGLADYDFKIGDGTTAFADLPYVHDNKIPLSTDFLIRDLDNQMSGYNVFNGRTDLSVAYADRLSVDFKKFFNAVADEAQLYLSARMEPISREAASYVVAARANDIIRFVEMGGYAFDLHTASFRTLFDAVDKIATTAGIEHDYPTEISDLHDLVNGSLSALKVSLQTQSVFNILSTMQDDVYYSLEKSAAVSAMLPKNVSDLSNDLDFARMGDISAMLLSIEVSSRAEVSAKFEEVDHRINTLSSVYPVLTTDVVPVSGLLELHDKFELMGVNMDMDLSTAVSALVEFNTYLGTLAR